MKRKEKGGTGESCLFQLPFRYRLLDPALWLQWQWVPRANVHNGHDPSLRQRRAEKEMAAGHCCRLPKTAGFRGH